jgi:hypothetical protein
MLSRRNVLWGMGGFCWISSTLVAAARDRVMIMAERWLAELWTMQAHARRRGWDLVQLEIEPPATEAEIRSLEIRHGLTMPAQLREVLLQISAQGPFRLVDPVFVAPARGIEPAHIRRPARQPMEPRPHRPEVDRILQRSAGPSRQPWRRRGARHPQMWNNQFPFAAVGGGDVLTIDMSLAKGPAAGALFQQRARRSPSPGSRK